MLLYFIITAITLLGFGFFWAYEARGSNISLLLSGIFLLLTCWSGALLLYSAVQNNLVSVLWFFGYNTFVGNTFAIGYNLGYHRKQKSYRWVAVLNGAISCFIVYYLIYR